MKPRVYKGGSPGHNTFYLLVPKDVVEALGIKPDDEFILNVEQKNDELVLLYRRIRKWTNPDFRGICGRNSNRRYIIL